MYIVDDPAPNAFAFGRSPQNAGVAVTSGLLNLMSRRELEGVLAHELSHIRNRDVQVTTLAVTTVGLLVVVADISARASCFADWGDDNNDGGAFLLIAVAAIAGMLAFGARLLSLAISRHREELADTSAVAIVSPDGLRRALEKLEADHTVLHHVSRATAHLWLVAPLHKEGDARHAQARTGCSTRTRRSTSASRSCASSKASTRTGAARSTRPPPACPSTSRKLAASTELRTARGTGATPAPSIPDAATTAVDRRGRRPAGNPPGWYHVDRQTPPLLGREQLDRVERGVERPPLGVEPPDLSKTAPRRRAPVRTLRVMTVQIDNGLDGVDWVRAKADLAADNFDNGRSPDALRRSFEQSQHVCDRARRRTGRGHGAPAVRRRVQRLPRRRVDARVAPAAGIASAMVRSLAAVVPGQHIGLQTDDAQEFYATLGFRPQPEFCRSWSVPGSTTTPTADFVRRVR